MVISGEALLCANLGFGLRLVSSVRGIRHTLLSDTGPEGAIFIRNCSNLGIRLGEVQSIDSDAWALGPHGRASGRD